MRALGHPVHAVGARELLYVSRFSGVRRTTAVCVGAEVEADYGSQQPGNSGENCLEHLFRLSPMIGPRSALEGCPEDDPPKHCEKAQCHILADLIPRPGLIVFVEFSSDAFKLWNIDRGSG